jgi:hypothetical protein
MLAFEIARQWLQREGVAPFVAMIGAPAPRRRTTTIGRVRHFFRWLPAWLALKAREGKQRTPTQMLRRFLRFLATDPAEIEPAMLHKEWAASPIAQYLITLETPYHPMVETPFDVHLFREGRPSGSGCMHPLGRTAGAGSLAGHRPPGHSARSGRERTGGQIAHVDGPALRRTKRPCPPSAIQPPASCS